MRVLFYLFIVFILPIIPYYRFIYLIFTIFTVCFLFIHTYLPRNGRKFIIAQHKDPLYVFLLNLIATIILYWFFFLDIQRYGFVNFFFASRTFVSTIGSILAESALVLIIDAKLTLGNMFYDGAGIYRNHVIVNKGPYVLVRHPIYLGYIIFYGGSSLVADSYIFAITCGLITFWAYKSRAIREEKLLLNCENTRVTYLSYSHTTPMFVPTWKTIVKYLKE